jgi:HlyD family secretion protein
MPRKLLAIAAALLGLTAGGTWYLRTDRTPLHYTGFVEGEERIIRSEVSGRVLDVRFSEGSNVPANEILAALDDRDIRTRVKSKQQEFAVTEAEIRSQEERVQLVDSTWQRDLSARQAELREAEATADLAERTYARDHVLVKSGVNSAQQLDDSRARRDQARSGLDRARAMLARTQAEERSIALARRELDMLREKRELTVAQLAELEVTASKYHIRAPATATVVQTQFVWPGELAQPGTAIVSVLDPTDKYVQIYVPVAEVSSGRDQFHRRQGQLHSREDRDPQRPHGPGLPRQGPHPRRRRALAAGDGRQRLRGWKIVRRRSCPTSRSSVCVGWRNSTANAARWPASI